MLHHAAARPNAPALREKYLGIWQTVTWGEVRSEVERLACGLASLGLSRGMALALIGENRPRLYLAQLAAQSIAAVPVSLYNDSQAAEMAYVLGDADVRCAVVEDQEQVDKLLEAREQSPGLAHLVYDEPRGLRNYPQPGLMSYEALLQAGDRWREQHPDFFEASVAAVSPEDVAAIFYTSGTTGHPKGVIHSHAALITMSERASKLDRLGCDDEILAYLPMAWIGQNIFSYAQWLVNGYVVNCPESQATVTIDMREIGPTYYFAPPRILEALLTQVTIRMEDAAPIKRALYSHFMAVARRVGWRILDGDRGVSLLDRLHYRLGNLLVYAPLRNALGMSRIRVAYTAGEAIGPDLFVFFRSLGINLKQLYGSTETAVFVCIQLDGQVRADSVGVPLPGVELKVADNGELLVRSPGLLKEYHHDPKTTAEVKDAEGWYHTGDAGYLDGQGQLRIIDRAKDVGRMAGGQMFAPKYIENKLKFFPFIKEAVAFGDGREQVMAFINMDFEACGNWAERRNLPYAGYVDLAVRPEIRALMRDCVEQVNRDLAADPMMAHAQIHRFVVLHKELDADDEELTRTRKVRRRFIAQRYQALVDALYEGREQQHVETPVRFEDGRTGTVAATLAIEAARVLEPAREAA